MNKNLPPIFFTGFGFLGLMASWSCLPPFQIGNFKDTTPTMAVRPSVKPMTKPTTTPIPDSAQIAPVVGRIYTAEQTGSNPATVVVTVTALEGETGTFEIATTASADKNTLITPPANGVYWLDVAVANPLTKDISGYPEEVITVKAGTFNARKVKGPDGTFYWFAQGVLLKSSNTAKATELELVKVQ